MSRNKQTNKRREANLRKKALKRKTRLRTGSIQEFSHQSLQDKTLKKKLSKVILEYAKPLIESSNGWDDEIKAISISVVFWNASLMPKTEAIESLSNFIGRISNNDESFEEDFYNIFQMMYDRKQKHYKSDHRVVMDYTLDENDEGLYFQVASTPINANE